VNFVSCTSAIRKRLRPAGALMTDPIPVSDTEETVLLRGFVASINAQREYDPDKGEYVYNLTGDPTCTIQLDGLFVGSPAIEVTGNLQFGKKYELVMRPVSEPNKKGKLSESIYQINKAPRKFNDEYP
jgi:hypothetical protein